MKFCLVIKYRVVNFTKKFLFCPNFFSFFFFKYQVNKIQLLGIFLLKIFLLCSSQTLIRNHMHSDAFISNCSHFRLSTNYFFCLSVWNELCLCRTRRYWCSVWLYEVYIWHVKRKLHLLKSAGYPDAVLKVFRTFFSLADPTRK